MLQGATGTAGQDLGSLFSGIVTDLQRLFRQELALARGEVKEELAAAKAAGLSLAVGTVLLYMTALLTMFMFVFLIYEAGGPIRQEGIPLWICFGIVALVTGAIGGITLAVGRRKAGKVHVVPPKTAAAIRETSAQLKESFSGNNGR